MLAPEQNAMVKLSKQELEQAFEEGLLFFFQICPASQDFRSALVSRRVSPSFNHGASKAKLRLDERKVCSSLNKIITQMEREKDVKVT